MNEREELVVPRAPTAGSALRAAFSGFYFNSLRLVAANALWSAFFVLTLLMLLVVPLLGALAFIFVLPLPTAGLFRLTTLIARGQPAALSDALDWRPLLRPAITAGVVFGSLLLILAVNTFFGFASLDPIGWAFGTAAAWGLAATWCVALATWPLLLDPERAGESVRGLFKLALIVIFVRPGRYLALMVVLAIVLVVSTILLAALLLVSVAFAALAMSFYVLPAADRIEQRRTFVVTS